MKLFFATIAAIHLFTAQLKMHSDTLSCKHCGKNDQFVSHGFVYKRNQHGIKTRVGKRILCTNRFKKIGCGRTTRLYLADHIPHLQFVAPHLFTFLLALISGECIRNSYKKISNADEPRNAYRWLKKLKSKTINFRSKLRKQIETATKKISSSPRLQIFVLTINQLFTKLGDSPIENYQIQYQATFL